MRYWKTEHDMALEKLLHMPGIVGISEPVQWSAREVQLYKPDGTGLITDIDLIYKTEKGIYVAEYKCTDTQRKKAEHQLELAKGFIEDQYSITPKMLYVFGDRFRTQPYLGSGRYECEKDKKKI